MREINNLLTGLARAFAVVVAAGAAFPMAVSADEWFVATNGVDAVGGGTEAEPFRTIKYAVGKASANDTVILLPGDHVEGSDDSSNGSSIFSRANIKKKLTIRSKNGRASRDVTRIVGAYATGGGDSDPVGIGTGAIRGLCFTSASSGSRVEGITFYRSAAGSVSDSTNLSDCGGGAVVMGDDTKVDFVDCAFVECRARRGGGLYHNAHGNANLQAVRCLFKNCADLKFGSAMRGGAAYFCVFDGNCLARSVSGGTSPSTVFDTGNGRPAFSYGYRAINCTFVNNQLAGLVVDGVACFKGGIYNNLFQRNQDGNNSYGVQFKSTSFSTLVSNGWVDALTNQVSVTSKLNVFSPFDGDYRLTVNSDAIGAGSATPLAKIPEEFRYTDYNGETIDPAGVINAGAVQEAITEAASGVSFADNAYGTWTLDGETVSPGFGGTWKGSIGWPVPLHLGFVPNEGRALIRFAIGGSPVWPLRDDTAWLHSSRIGIARGADVSTTTNIYYADPVNGSDDTGDGSEANPYKTLNKAVNATNATHVVFAKAGDYCTAEESFANNKNRVVVPSTLAGNLRVVAVEGPENTFISGASDPSTSNGTGANAVRCIAVASTNNHCAAFQGFTLRDGRTGDKSAVPSQGAALYNINNAFTNFDTGVLLDCVVTNCSGNRAGCISGGSAYRCRFYDCKSFNSGGQCVLRYCSIFSSSFTGCGGQSQLFGNTAKGYNCTIYGSVGDAPQSIYTKPSDNSYGYLYNCVSGRPSGTDINEATTDGQLVNTLYCRMASTNPNTLMASTNPNTFTTAVKETPLKLMDAAGGDYRLLPDSAGVWLASTAYLKSCMDIDGKPFAFKDDHYQAGCHAMRGSTIYVDATNGNDENDGSSEGEAFRTLAAVMNAADYGDTVIALPGTYDSGTMVPTQAESCYTAAPTLPARVVVKGGVTLESRDGVETTVIKGAASTSSGRSDGCGDGAVRGVFLCVGATLRGFTVTGGRTLYLTSGTIDSMGGGVCGPYDSTDGSAMQWRGLVEDCIISNNVARSGGGAQYGTYRNCRFFGNSTYNLGYGLCRAFAEGCAFKGNGSSGNSTLYDCKVVNCTVLGGQASNNGLVCNEGVADYLPIFNSIVLGNYKSGVTTNCCFLTGATNKATVTPRENGNITGDASIVDADGKPVADVAVIDAGDASFCSAALLAGRDVAGARRVLNSTIDIGAFEYDWGVPWAKTLGNRRLTIDDMPSDAALAGNRLTFADGTVSMTWEKGRSNAPYIYNVRVIGNGTLTVTVNGEAVGSYTSADGARELRFASALAANALQFAYVPGDGDTGGAELYGFNHSNWYISFR